jgi:hypothetical protein
MSSNLSVINFGVGGTLSISGKTTLGDTLLSSSSANFQGLQTTNLSVSGTSTFNNSLPTSTQTPVLENSLITKIYVDTADGVQKTYIDDADTVLNNRITSVDNSRKTYVDDADRVLDNRITSVDNSRKTYVDDADNVLDTKIKTYGKKGYYIQNGGKVYLESDLGFSQFIELRTSTGEFSYYTTFLPNPTTCAGQIVYIWNNTIEDQGVDQTGDNLFVRNVENRVYFKGPVLQD